MSPKRSSKKKKAASPDKPKQRKSSPTKSDAPESKAKKPAKASSPEPQAANAPDVEAPLSWMGHLTVAGAFGIALFGGALFVYRDERFGHEAGLLLGLATVLTLLFLLATLADAALDRLAKK
jgi:hypothetical protein